MTVDAVVAVDAADAVAAVGAADAVAAVDAVAAAAADPPPSHFSSKEELLFIDFSTDRLKMLFCSIHAY